MQEIEVAVIGGGPAGLGAAIEAGRLGAKVWLFDENYLPGGQLFKQIHKFFGSKDHYAGVRGFKIGELLLEQAKAAGVNLKLNSKVLGILEDGCIAVQENDTFKTYHGKTVILATGAKENALVFPGWTLPGVMTAGAAQTFVNVHRVKPGQRALVVGSGNVGLILSYQLSQAGIQVAAIVEAKDSITGYDVHAGKVKRLGIPILTSHTVKEALGSTKVEQAVIVKLDESFSEISGTEKTFDIDLLCIAVGLSPRNELVRQFQCRSTYIGPLGGKVPVHNQNMETSQANIFVAGDVAGVEEASTALEEGRVAGIAAAAKLGYLGHDEAARCIAEYWQHLDALRSGQKIRLEAKSAILREGAQND